MLSLRVALGSRPEVLLRRLLVVAAAAGTGFLLLAVLGHALAHPADAPDGLVRLLWCAAPFAATVHLSVLVARTEPSGRLHAGLAAAGLGRHGLPLLAAASSALNCGLGVLTALLGFLFLRGDLPGPHLAGAAEALGADRELPFAGALTLSATLPLAAAVAAAVVLRPRRSGQEEPAGNEGRTPSGLPWGVALVAIGLAVQISSAGDAGAPGPGGTLPLPGGLGHVAPAVVGGWLLTATGMVLAMPGLVHLCGRLLASYRPGALRLLAGRALQEEAALVGRPLGALCAVAATALAGTDRLGAAAHPVGPLTALGAFLVVLSAVATALTATVDAKRARRPATAALTRLGAPAALLRNAAAVRALAVLGVVLPLTLLIARLGTLPLP
ncbi:hypothetical protein [Actinacidiphila glaucinigra]|uniref:Uncharacterized protein n=1 Tax=Actinacidiphila glaucinigra TaxID=235986 RepID=A0A239GTF4_9ACTN|nr:hypothetical protein [Actinacidiphila glaucinigra]SNS72165.1 hypothetical protein SAMN05216252_10829 [Actinacidiphila glaucinigra]